jgi:hypothetical protein
MITEHLWKAGIAAILIGGAIASYKTVQIALENPVEQSSIYMSGYHSVDKNINDILNSQLQFNAKYKISEDISVKNGVLRGNIAVYNSSGEKVNAEIEILVTRPETDAFDKNFKGESFEYQLPKEGRWKVYIKASIDKLEGYLYLEANTKNDTVLKLDPFISQKRIEEIEREKENRIKRLLGE